jgi:hypothetical protein
VEKKMRYRELKNRVVYLKKLGYAKYKKGWGGYRKVFSQNGYNTEQWISEHDIFNAESFYDYLLFLEDKNIMLLMAYGWTEQEQNKKSN